MLKTHGVRLPFIFKEYSRKWRLDSSNFLTLTNPKVSKNGAIAPTVVWHGLPLLHNACPAAGTCKYICLNKAGNVQYLRGKLATRKRRSDAFYYDHNTTLQFLVWQVLRHRARFAHLPVVGARLNGTTDHRWEHEYVEFDDDIASFIYDTTGYYVVNNETVVELLSRHGVQLYDYTKRIDRDFAYCAKHGYHLTMSHGSVHGVEALRTAYKYGLNYAVAFNGISNYHKKREPLPRYIRINDEGLLDPNGKRVLNVVDGDTTDWRPGDPRGTNVIGLRVKRVHGYSIDPAKRVAAEAGFCADPALYVW